MMKIKNRYYCKSCKKVHRKGEILEAEICRFCGSHTSRLYDLNQHGLTSYHDGLSACENCTQALYNQEKLRGSHTDPWIDMMMGDYD
jgi:hypothetical protein